MYTIHIYSVTVILPALIKHTRVTVYLSEYIKGPFIIGIYNRFSAGLVCMKCSGYGI